ncbi:MULTISPECIES: oxidoreductase [unclassified Hyphomicrobium]|uniref:oxidoreductase n=1 Tax=unclassified Hyphomicrobium TaxID=2619925 RepID=UPI000213D686|nr:MULTISPECIES: oxidoreductase [unclassified Hyphomicrobium]CCB68121.1 Short-chain dehydrogenase/reductase SDR [Hyphomicrobium sp. MC1]
MSSKLKVALVTGASSGIGMEAARSLRSSGFTVYGAARRVDRMRELENDGIHIISLDVTDEKSILDCVKTIADREGRIDVLINNAGYGSYGAIENVPLSEARSQFEVNVFGLARLTQAVLPLMRAHNFGRIISISSIGGKIHTPFGGWYHATKFAVEGLSDCLRLEVQRFGIDVIVIEPGGIKTDWGIIAANHLRETSGSGAYASDANKTADGMLKTYQGNRLSPPSVIAKAIVQAATATKPRTRYAVGFGAKPILFMRRWLSDRMFDALIKRASA